MGRPIVSGKKGEKEKGKAKKLRKVKKERKGQRKIEKKNTVNAFVSLEQSSN